MGAVENIQLELDRGQPVAELGVLPGESVLTNLLTETHIEQPVLLSDNQGVLALELGQLGPRLGLRILRLRGQDRPEPVTDRLILDPHAIEDRHDLPFYLWLRNADAGMSLSEIATAPVVDVHLVTGLPVLDDPFAGHRPPAMAAVHELAGVGDVQTVVKVTPEEGLHAVPGGPVHKRLVLAPVELALEVDLTDVGSVAQHRVYGGAGEPQRTGAIHQSLIVKSLNQTVDRDTFVRVEVEHAPDVRRGVRIDGDHAAPVHANIPISVGRPANEPAILDTTGLALPHIDGELLGIEARHVGEGPPHHSAGRIALGRLGDGDEGEAMLALQPFELHVVEEVASGAIDLVEQEGVEFLGVLLGVGDEFTKGLALITLARRLRDAEESDDVAARVGGVSFESILLDRKREPLAFLFPAADPGQCDKAFHGLLLLREDAQQPASAH